MQQWQERKQRQNQIRWLGDRRNTGAWPQLVAAISHRGYQVGGIRLAVAIEVARRPFGVRPSFVSARRQHGHQILRIELPIQIGVADPAVVQIDDPRIDVLCIDDAVTGFHKEVVQRRELDVAGCDGLVKWQWLAAQRIVG